MLTLSLFYTGAGRGGAKVYEHFEYGAKKTNAIKIASIGGRGRGDKMIVTGREDSGGLQ